MKKVLFALLSMSIMACAQVTRENVVTGGNQTISGTKTFSDGIAGTLTGTATYATTSGSASNSGTSAYATTSGSASNSGTAAYATTTGTLAATSVSGTAIVTGTSTSGGLTITKSGTLLTLSGTPTLSGSATGMMDYTSLSETHTGISFAFDTAGNSLGTQSTMSGFTGIRMVDASNGGGIGFYINPVKWAGRKAKVQALIGVSGTTGNVTTRCWISTGTMTLPNATVDGYIGSGNALSPTSTSVITITATNAANALYLMETGTVTFPSNITAGSVYFQSRRADAGDTSTDTAALMYINLTACP